MKKTAYSAAAVVLAVVACFGLPAGSNVCTSKPAAVATPAVRAPAPLPIGTIPVGQIAQLSFTDLTAEVAKKSHIGFYPRPSGAVFFPAVGLNGDVVVFFSSPAAARLLVWIDSPGPAGAVQHAEMEVVVGTPGPTPEPEPPTPVPPTPVADLWGVAIIGESRDQSNDLASLATSPDVEAYFASAGLAPLRVVDKDAKDKNGNPSADLAPYISRAKADGLPRMLGISKAGKIAFSADPPKKGVDLIAYLKAYKAGRKR